jgi:two-component system nitrogen regulation response regulator NtrX
VERGTTVDVRVIAATHRHLEAEIEAGRFREDLYYRLNVVPVRMPALRERREDIPEIADHFIGRLRARDGLAPPRLDTAALRVLRAHGWPGNVRELANICERLVILHAGSAVTADDVQELIGGRGRYETRDEAPLTDRLDRFEREAIARALAASDGSVAEAARRLQTDRANLYRRMRRLGIEP